MPIFHATLMTMLSRFSFVKTALVLVFLSAPTIGVHSVWAADTLEGIENTKVPQPLGVASPAQQKYMGPLWDGTGKLIGAASSGFCGDLCGKAFRKAGVFLGVNETPTAAEQSAALAKSVAHVSEQVANMSKQLTEVEKRLDADIKNASSQIENIQQLTSRRTEYGLSNVSLLRSAKPISISMEHLTQRPLSAELEKQTMANILASDAIETLLGNISDEMLDDSAGRLAVTYASFLQVIVRNACKSDDWCFNKRDSRAYVFPDKLDQFDDNRFYNTYILPFAAKWMGLQSQALRLLVEAYVANGNPDQALKLIKHYTPLFRRQIANFGSPITDNNVIVDNVNLVAWTKQPWCGQTMQQADTNGTVPLVATGELCKKYTKENAYSAAADANKANFAGYNDWRIPNLFGGPVANGGDLWYMLSDYAYNGNVKRARDQVLQHLDVTAYGNYLYRQGFRFNPSILGKGQPYWFAGVGEWERQSPLNASFPGDLNNIRATAYPANTAAGSVLIRNLTDDNHQLVCYSQTFGIPSKCPCIDNNGKGIMCPANNPVYAPWVDSLLPKLPSIKAVNFTNKKLAIVEGIFSDRSVGIDKTSDGKNILMLKPKGDRVAFSYDSENLTLSLTKQPDSVIVPVVFGGPADAGARSLRIASSGTPSQFLVREKSISEATIVQIMVSTEKYGLLYLQVKDGATNISFSKYESNSWFYLVD